MLQLQLLWNVVSFVFLPGRPLSLLLPPLYTRFFFSVSALPCQPTWPSIFLLQQWAKKQQGRKKKKNQFAAPWDAAAQLPSLLATISVSPLYAPPLPLNCNLLPFGWLLLPRHWGSSCSTSATAARINGRQLKQITFIVITPHVSPTPISLSLSSPTLACPHLPCVLSVWLIRKLCCILCALCSFYRVWVGVWLPKAAAIWLHI